MSVVGTSGVYPASPRARPRAARAPVRTREDPAGRTRPRDPAQNHRDANEDAARADEHARRAW